MAVKPEKIKERLKALFPKANLSQKRIDEISAKLATKPADDADDAAVDAFINDANELMGFEAMAKEDDRVRTLEANQKPKPEPPTPPTPPTDPPTPPADDTPGWAKTIIETNQKLSKEIEDMKQGKITDAKRQTAQQAIEASEVFKGLKPEVQSKWAGRIDINSETSFEDQVKEFETEFTDIKQTLANTAGYAGSAPSGGVADAKFSQEVADKIVDGIL